jgi:chemotaxis protein MotA
MFAIIGTLVVTVAVFGGYLMQGGNLSVLWAPAKIVMIFGAAVGGLILGSPAKVLKAVIASVGKILAGKSYSKSDYMEVLLLLSEIFAKIRKEGLISIEADVDNPEASQIFSKYPKFLKNHHAVNLLTDTLRTVMTTSIAPHELESLIDNELEAHHEEAMVPSKSMATMAEAFPGIGIAAAVLGVVITMQYLDQPPAILGPKVGAALLGTFLGVLLCYGYFAPMANNLEHIAAEDKDYLNVIKTSLVAFVGGAAPQIAVEFGRRVIPGNVKPTFVEVEEAIRQLKK